MGDRDVNVDVSLTVRREVLPGIEQRVMAGVLSKKVHFLAEIYFKTGLETLIQEDSRFKGWKVRFPLVTYPTDLDRSRREDALAALVDWMNGFKYPSSSS